MTDIAALVERLREYAKDLNSVSDRSGTLDPSDLLPWEAADALEACQAENRTLRNAGVDLLTRAEKAEAEIERLRADSLLHRKLYAEEAHAKMVMAELTLKERL